MKKIFCYVGSRNNNSGTLRLCKSILEKVREECNEEVRFNIYSPCNSKIDPCIGCVNCFVKGKCVLDNVDDCKTIKEKMLEADFIILASPVYLHAVSGDMKVFIDRISYWSHLLRLNRKLGFNISTSAGNGHIYVRRYLNKISTYMGINVIGSVGVDIPDRNLFNENDFLKREVEYIAKKIVSGLESDDKYKSSIGLENVFKTYKGIMVEQSESEYSNAIEEHKYWERERLIYADTYQDFLNSKKKLIGE